MRAHNNILIKQIVTDYIAHNVPSAKPSLGVLSDALTRARRPVVGAALLASRARAASSGGTPVATPTWRGPARSHRIRSQRVLFNSERRLQISSELDEDRVVLTR